MILHCYFCSLGGSHLTEASQVAIIDEAKIGKPLTADMFKPLKPQHDPSPPFDCSEWLHMKHRACGRYPWVPVNIDPIHGPRSILTDEGELNLDDLPPFVSPSTVVVAHTDNEAITEDGTVKPITDLSEIRANGDGRKFKYMKASNQPQYQCPVPGCGKVCKNAAGLSGHMRVHKEE